MRRLGFPLAAAAAFLAVPALAAPQPLALVATLGPVELICDGAQCAAEFSAFCLQEERGSPDRGQAYAPHGDLRLVARDAAGREVELPVDLLAARAARTHVAVRLALPEAALRARGLATPRVVVGEGAALSPAPVAGDAQPLSAAEFAVAAGPLRRTGARLVDRDEQRMPAVRLLNRLLNALPANGVEPRDGLWSRIAAPLAPGLPAEAVRQARATHERCEENVSTGVDPTLRRCLESRHDSLLGALNADYWRAVKTGS